METDFAYDANGNLIAAALPAANGSPRPTTYVTYDAHNNVVAECDPVWSDANHLDWIATPAPTYSPCPANAANSPTNPGPTLYTYTAPPAAPFGELSAVTKPMGYKTTITYETGPQGGSVDFGLPASIVGVPITQSDGSLTTHQTQYYYDQYGNTICSVSLSGIDSSPIYDTSINIYTGPDALLGRVTQHGDPDDASLSNGNANGACPKTSGISGSTITTSYTYFSTGQIQSKQLPTERAAGVSTQYSYDPDGNLINTITNLGGLGPATTAHFYDADDKLVEVVKPGGWDTRYDYDLSQNSTNGNPVTLVGVTTAFKAHGAFFKIQEYHSGFGWIDTKGDAYDALGRSVDSYTYTPNANCNLGNFSTCESASTTARVYDGAAGAGLLDHSTDAVGTKSTFLYRNAGEIKSFSFNDGTNGTQFEYDLDGRVISAAEICSPLCPTYIESDAYDRDGNLVQKTEQPEHNSAPSVLTYQYYPDGMRESISLSGAITQNNLFTYDYDSTGRSRNSTLTFNATTENFGLSQTRAGRWSSEVDPYSTTTASYDTAAGRLQTLTPPEGATSFGSYDPEGEVLAFTEPNSTTAVSQGFDSSGEMTGQTPPGADPNGCALGFTAVGSQGYMTTSGSSWDPDTGNCIPVTLTGTEDVRNAVQVTEPVQLSNKKFQLFESVSFDADGRMAVGYNDAICCGQTSDQITRSYDAESRLINQYDGLGNLQMKRIYGPDGHIVQIGTTDANHVLHLETLHWDGDAILFTTNDAGQTDDVKIGNTADYFPQDPSSQAKLTMWDRDYTGHMRGCHNGGGHSSWSQLDPYNANGNPLPPIGGCTAPAMYGKPIGQGGAILRPDGDGYWDGIVMIQGARDFDSTLRGWIEPDPSSGTTWNPMTQKSYTWNDNNPSELGDQTGRSPSGESAWGPGSALMQLDAPNGNCEVAFSGDCEAYSLAQNPGTFLAANNTVFSPRATGDLAWTNILNGWRVSWTSSGHGNVLGDVETVTLTWVGGLLPAEGQASALGSVGVFAGVEQWWGGLNGWEKAGVILVGIAAVAFVAPYALGAVGGELLVAASFGEGGALALGASFAAYDAAEVTMAATRNEWFVGGMATAGVVDVAGDALSHQH
jgi:YD repeat-containing protein